MWYRDPDEPRRIREAVQWMIEHPQELLDPTLVPEKIRAIFATRSRRELDRMTKQLWKQYDRPENADQLERLKLAILHRRQELTRT